MSVSSTVFNDIPAALRVPGWYIEFDNRLAGNAVFQGKLLVLGQMAGAELRGSHKWPDLHRWKDSCQSESRQSDNDDDDWAMTDEELVP